MNELAIKIEGVKKQYRLGTIGGGTLTADLQSWWARKRGKEDPNLPIGQGNMRIGEAFWALNGIDLDVKKGETLGIIGSNGAGKSTLLKILSRVTAPTEGIVKINGKIASMLEVGTGFHGELTGRENIYMNGAILGMTRKEVDEKIKDIIEFSECKEFIDTPVKRYSSGMYVKLAFAVAAHLDSDIMIMDEVLAVGDIKFQQKCLTKMGDASNIDGKTVLYVSHNMSTIRQLCSRCIVLNKGSIVFDGDVESAIQIYMDAEKKDFRCEYNLQDAARPSADHGRIVHVDSFKFLNKEKAVFEENETIEAQINWHGNGDVKGLRLYLAIKYADDSSVGVAKSEVIGDCQKGCSNMAKIKMCLHNLAPGSYYFYVNIISMNELGTPTSHDRPNLKVCFDVISKEEKTFEWKNKDMGYIRFADIQVWKDK